MIALVQEVPRSQADKNAFQEFDHFKLFDPVTKSVLRIDEPSRVDDYVDMAFTAARKFFSPTTPLKRCAFC